MSQDTAAATPVAGGAADVDPKRWLALVVIAIAQLMVVLDATIVNIAMPGRRRRWRSPTPTGSGSSRRTR
ncbi:hypothetical protein [Phytohabitans rumicis]|uniref:Uncharacterized protein n=1 Tax=Phytohabitans rumicis TaxID=1076125 RepID=A0A6V8LCN9_9ACTN|nr:hypothetical protein [Phytohabitans rumicis]GFJ94992.1 hypothetical protein Prum_086340 [Phytohabitans rumicis]